MEKNIKLFIAATFVAVGAFVFLSVLIQATIYAPVQEVAPSVGMALAATAISPNEYPSRILIPQVAVDAVIQDRGLVAGGRMAAPSNFTSVGWYEYGVVPGQVGTAVLYAHLDNGLGLNGVFKNLDELPIGGEVDITTVGGAMKRFIVSDIETYPYQNLPLAALGEAPSNGVASITLITCAGNPTHDPVEGYTYDHRLVVYATLINS